MPIKAQLILQPTQDNPAKAYRIQDGNVEVRSLNGGSDEGSGWWRLSPQQISTHVERNTVVARWLESRMGWRRLLQACVGQDVSEMTSSYRS
jgi:hypothetical protein